MRSASILVAALAVGAGSMLMARDAHALGPLDLEIGAKAGVGTAPVDLNVGGPVSLPNPLGFGIGGRAGVSILGLYGGVQAMYYFGSSEENNGAKISSHAGLYGVEVGYGLTLLDLVTIRPQVGIGNATLTWSGTAAGIDASHSDSNLYIEPGITGLVSLAGWFVGADANLLFLPGFDDTEIPGGLKSKVGVTIHGQIGIKL